MDSNPGGLRYPRGGSSSPSLVTYRWVGVVGDPVIERGGRSRGSVVVSDARRSRAPAPARPSATIPSASWPALTPADDAWLRNARLAAVSRARLGRRAGPRSGVWWTALGRRAGADRARPARWRAAAPGQCGVSAEPRAAASATGGGWRGIGGRRRRALTRGARPASDPRPRHLPRRFPHGRGLDRRIGGPRSASRSRPPLDVPGSWDLDRDVRGPPQLLMPWWPPLRCRRPGAGASLGEGRRLGCSRRRYAGAPPGRGGA